MIRFEGRISGANSRDLRASAVTPSAAHASIRDWTAISVGRDRPRFDGGCWRPNANSRAEYDVLGPVGPPGKTVRRLLAAAARTRGETTPHDEEIRRLESRLAALEVPKADTTEEKRRVVDASRNEAELRERIAALRGQLQTERKLDEPTEGTADALAAAAAELSEASTDRIAAEQALEAAERAARAARSARDRRLKLQDRLENRRREARAFLADALTTEFEAAIDRVDPLVAGGADDPTAAKAHLAAVATAELRAPIVVDARWTGIHDVERTADVLETAVWLCEP